MGKGEGEEVSRWRFARILALISNDHNSKTVRDNPINIILFSGRRELENLTEQLPGRTMRYNGIKEIAGEGKDLDHVRWNLAGNDRFQ